MPCGGEFLKRTCVRAKVAVYFSSMSSEQKKRETPCQLGGGGCLPHKGHIDMSLANNVTAFVYFVNTQFSSGTATLSGGCARFFCSQGVKHE